MSGLARFVEILRLFDEQKSDWTIQEMAEAVKVPASTVYRTVRELVAQSFLDPSKEGYYRLGAAFIEFDRRLRLADPLIRHGSAIIQDLVGSLQQPCVAVVARLYRDQVICVADARSTGATILTSYERGRPMPLVRGATSKAILSQLSKPKLRKVIGGAVSDDRSFDGVAAELSAIRKRGYSITRGEVDTGLVGISVPVANSDAAITASLSLILSAGDLDETIERRLLMTILPAATMLAEKLNDVVPNKAV
jgi:DNA-binding IclR family transcriptional regulator